MPSKSAHTTQAQHNLFFFSSFYDGDHNNDWAITVAFYSAVHAIEHAIEADTQIPEDVKKRKDEENGHDRRNRLVEGYFPKIEHHYKHLFKEARKARYYFYMPSKLAVELDVKTHLKNILNWSDGNYGTSYELDFSKKTMKA